MVPSDRPAAAEPAPAPPDVADETAARARVPTRVRAAFLRAYAANLARDGLLERVAAAVPRYTCALLVDPPAPTAWIASTVVEDVDAVVESLRGPAALEDYSRRATRGGILPLVLPALRAALDLFGLSPGVIYARVALFSQVGSRGIEYEWTSTGPRGGVMEVRYVGRPDVPWRTFVGIRGMLTVPGELTRAQCTVSAPEPVSDARDAVARYTIEW